MNQPGFFKSILTNIFKHYKIENQTKKKKKNIIVNHSKNNKR